MKTTRSILICVPLLLSLVSFPVAAAERDAVIKIDGCTGFVVEGNLLVTAKHCRHPETMTVTVQNQTVIARKIYSASNEDGPVVFRLQGGPFESLPVAKQAPQVNDAVYSLGYPGGHWARIEGEIIGGNGVDLNYTNHRVATGNSGGPLLNSDGEVIGIALHVDADLAVHRSGFTGWRVTSNAISQASGKQISQRGPPQGKPVIVVFSLPGCGPCNALKRDVKAGHFDEYEFKFVNQENGRWSDDAEYRAFWLATKPSRKQLSYPTIWVKGTKNYKVGYDSNRKGGLLGWLRGAVRFLLGSLIGNRETLPLPEPPPDLGQPDKLPIPINPPNKESEVIPSAVEKLIADLKVIKEQGLKTKADVAEFQNAGVIGKVKLIGTLKENSKDLQASIASIRGDVTKVRSDFKENPVQFLWGLFGIVSGLLQRRFLKEEVA